jgi:gluconolactonase
MNSWTRSSISLNVRFHCRVAEVILLLLLVSGVSLLEAQIVRRLPVTVGKIAGGFQFVEGPVWKDGVGLLFSDIEANKIYRWVPETGVKEYLFPSDSSNGLTYDREGRLVLTQMRLRRIARLEKNGSITPLASTYRNKRFNCPNDLVYSAAGSLFFTDPDFNIPSGQSSELGFRGVYRVSTRGYVQMLDSTFDEPNGICFSPDGKTLYVNDSPQCIIYAWKVVNDSTITKKRVFFSIPRTGYADGMKTDPAGNVYCTGPRGVWVIAPSGSLLGLIPIPESPTNCAWGDADRKTLYVTATSGVYRVRWTSPEPKR